MKDFLKSRRRSFGFAFEGIAYAFRTQPNMKIHLAVAVLVIFFGLLLRVDATSFAILILCIGFVLTSELINTSIEKAIDIPELGIHPLVKIVKDVSAAAVLLSALTAAIAGLLIFIPALITFLSEIFAH